MSSVSDNSALWLCPNGHAMGMVYQDDARVSYLIEFEAAFIVGQTPTAIRPGRIYEKQDAVCTQCGKRKTFGLDPRKLDRLVKRVLAQRKTIRELES